MHLSIKAIVAIGVFLTSAIAITGLSLRVMAGTKMADEKFVLTESVARASWSALEREPTSLQPGQTVLDDSVESGFRYRRELNVVDNGDTLIVELTVTRVGDKALPKVYKGELPKP